MSRRTAPPTERSSQPRGAPRRPAGQPASIEEAFFALAELVRTGARVGAGSGGQTEDLATEATATGAADDRAEQRIWLAEARYRALIEQIPAVTFLASVAGGRDEIYVSPQIESLLGFTQEEWVSDPVLWWRQTHLADRDRVSVAFAASCATGQPFRDEFRVVARDGQTIWVHAEARLVRDEEGQPLFLQGVGFDVTEQRRAQETREQLIREQAARAQVERERELRNQFLAAVAHDLKTPLTSVQGLVQLLERRIARTGVSAEELSATLGQVRTSARRMASLLDQLLDVTRMQMDQHLTLNRQAFDLRRLVAEAIDGHRGLSDRHELVLEVPRSEIWGSWDPARLDRVVSNLLGNAIKYSPQGGRVALRLTRTQSPAGAQATLEVEDQGIGIPAEDLPHIFDRFQRAGNVGHVGGTGIGLAYVRQVVEEHGGRIDVQSREGAGSTFTIHLPIEEPADHE